MNQNNCVCVHEFETKNKQGNASPAIIDPKRMNGRRRPHLVRVLSDNHPNNGSVKASTNRVVARAMLTRVGDSPRKTLNTGFARLLYSQCPKMSVVPPIAYANFALGGTLSSGATSLRSKSATSWDVELVTDLRLSWEPDLERGAGVAPFVTGPGPNVTYGRAAVGLFS